MDESLSFDECDKRGHNLWLVPTGNGSALSRLYPQSDVEADIGYTDTQVSVRGVGGHIAPQKSLLKQFALQSWRFKKKAVQKKKAVGGFLVKLTQRRVLPC